MYILLSTARQGQAKQLSRSRKKFLATTYNPLFGSLYLKLPQKVSHNIRLSLHINCLLHVIHDSSAASTTPSLEPVVVLSGEDLAATAVLIAVNGKQPDESHPLPLVACRVVPVALVRWLMRLRTISCMLITSFCV